MYFSSYTPWNIKIVWIKAIYNRATKICSNQKLLDDQMKKICHLCHGMDFQTMLVIHYCVI